MTKKEFLEGINRYGIQLYIIGIYIDTEVDIPFHWEHTIITMIRLFI